jgi:hypothetical protein
MSDAPEELERLVRAARGESPDPDIRERALERLLAANGATVAHTNSRRNVAFVLAAAATVLLITAAFVRRGTAPPIAAERLPPSVLAARDNGVSPKSVAPLVPAPDMPGPPPSAISPVTSSKAAPRASASNARPLSLEEETKALEAVQAELRAGRARAALGLLDRYDRAAVGGGMTAESRLLRIEALTGTGNTAAAARLAREFVSTYPNSPLVDRVRKYLAPAPTGDGKAQSRDNGRQAGDEKHD